MSKIMAWSKCTIECATSTGAMASSLTSIGTVKDRSAVLESEDGDELRAVATGGELVAYERLEGAFTLTCRVIEPETTFYSTLFGLGTVSSDDVSVTTHVPTAYYSVKVTPKNIGAYGIEARYTNVSIKPGWSEEEGNYVDVTFAILHGSANYWYKRFKVPTPTP